MGIALNYDTIEETGRSAEEAINLAGSRGGDQVVVFEKNREILYFGGIKNIQVSLSRVRSKAIANAIEQIIIREDVIYAVTHRNPDLDAIGAILILNDLARSHDKQLKVLIDEDASPLIKEQLERVDLNIVKAILPDKPLFILDTQGYDIVSHPDLVLESNNVIIIDHHSTPDNYIKSTTLSYIMPNVSSTVELMLDISKNFKAKVKYNKAELDIILSGIISDTNNFTHRTSQYTFESIAFAISKGGVLEDAYSLLDMSYDDILTKNKFSNNLKQVDSNAVYSIVDEDVDQVVQSNVTNDFLKIKDIDLSLTVVRSGEDYSIKIRTNKSIKAQTIAKQFGGGGHDTQAAAIIAISKTPNIEQLIIKTIEKAINKKVK